VALTVFPKIKLQGDFQRLAASEVPSVVFETELQALKFDDASEEVEKLKQTVADYRKKLELAERAFKNLQVKMRQEKLEAFKTALLEMNVPPASMEHLIATAKTLLEADRFEEVDRLLQGLKLASFSEVGKPTEDLSPAAETVEEASNWMDRSPAEIEEAFRKQGLL